MEVFWFLDRSQRRPRIDDDRWPASGSEGKRLARDYQERQVPHVPKGKLSLEGLWCFKEGHLRVNLNFLPGEGFLRFATHLPCTVSLFSLFMVRFITAINETRAHEFHMTPKCVVFSTLNFAPVFRRAASPIPVSSLASLIIFVSPR